MEMERINDDTIKILIAPEDLEERGIDFMELISNHGRIEQFFYSILEEVDVDHQFADSDSVTFHVIPSERGLELYISRSGASGIENLLENEVLRRLLNRRKSLLKGMQQEAKADDAKVNEKIEVLEDLTKELEQEFEQSMTREDLDGSEVVRFANLEDFLAVARRFSAFPVGNSLYCYEGAYYLVLSDVQGEQDEEGLYHQFLLMLEYGEESGIKEWVLKEHGQMLQEEDALAFFSQF